MDGPWAALFLEMEARLLAFLPLSGVTGMSPSQ